MDSVCSNVHFNRGNIYHNILYPSVFPVSLCRLGAAGRSSASAIDIYWSFLLRAEQRGDEQTWLLHAVVRDSSTQDQIRQGEISALNQASQQRVRREKEEKLTMVIKPTAAPIRPAAET